jgi:hypothetical protein
VEQFANTLAFVVVVNGKIWTTISSLF